MTIYAFRFTLLNPPTEEQLTVLVDDLGVADCTFGREDGLPIVEFDREAPSLIEAVQSAEKDLVEARIEVVVAHEIVIISPEPSKW